MLSFLSSKHNNNDVRTSDDRFNEQQQQQQQQPDETTSLMTGSSALLLSSTTTAEQQQQYVLPLADSIKRKSTKPHDYHEDDNEELTVTERSFLFRSYNSLVALSAVDQIEGEQQQQQQQKQQHETTIGSSASSSPNDDMESLIKHPADHHHRRRRRRRINPIWLLGFALIPTFLVKGSQRMTLPVMPELITVELGGTDAELGIVVASVGFGKLISNLPSGHLIGHIGSYLGLLLSVSVLCITWVLASISTSVRDLILSGLLEGLGLSLWQLSRQNLITKEIGLEDGRGRVQSLIAGLERISSVFGPWLGGYLVGRTKSLRSPFWAKASFMLGDAILFAILILARYSVTSNKPSLSSSSQPVLTSSNTETQTTSSSNRPDLAKVSTRSSPPSSFLDTLKQVLHDHHQSLQIVSLWVLFMPIARETRLFLFPLRATDMGYNPHAIGIMTSITFVVDSSMFPLAGYLMDTYGRKYAGVPSMILLALSYALAPLAPTMTWLTAASALSGMGNGLSGGVLTIIGSDLATPITSHHERALFLGVFRTISDAGIFLGPIVSGAISEALTLADAFYVVAVTTCLATLWMVFVMPETRWARVS